MSSYFIIGTAGHVDHGKTELIKALTGIDTDRLPEEKKRGMSIDLGFAYFQLPDGRMAGIVDVPGHERFVHNMLAGAAGMDLVLMVIAADEGVMAQTIEHLNILQLLDVKDGIIVVTKIDLVDDEWLELVCEDIREHMKGTFLESAPIVTVSSVTREGIDELVQLLQQRAQHASTKHVDRPFRLPIDRAFIKAGFGSIVTGTAFSGELSIGDEVEIAPQGIRARVRGLQVHQRTVERVYAGQRVAINLAGVEREELERGNVVTEPGYLLPTKRIAVQLHLLHNAPRPLRDGTPIRLHVGTGEWVARILLLSGDQLEPGETAFAEVRINDAIACARFDRFVIRSYSPIHTIGGGIILEPYPLRYRRRSRDYWYSCERKAQQDYTVTALTLLEENAMGLSLQQLCVLLHIRPQHAREIINVLVEDNRAIELGTHFYMSIRTYQQVRDELISAVKAYHTAHPLHRGIDKSMLLARLKGVNDADTFESLLERFETEGVIVVDREVVRLPEHTVELTGHYAEIAKRMERVCMNATFTAPTLDELLKAFHSDSDVATEVLHALLDQGRLVRVDEFIFHPSVIERAKRIVAQHIRERGKITVAEFRDAIGVSRKFATPLLEYLDQIGFTQRIGDHRILRQS